MIKNIDKNDIMSLTGCTKTQAENLLKQAKAIMVADGFPWYKNKRVGRVPIQAVEQIVGFKIDLENDIIELVQKGGTVTDKDNK